jgi:hypothetical protein
MLFIQTIELNVSNIGTMEDDSSIDSVCKQLNFDEEVHHEMPSQQQVSKLDNNAFIKQIFHRFNEELKQKYVNIKQDNMVKRKKSTNNNAAKNGRNTNNHQTM